MSNYKMFDGTNWLDPCLCNISIRGAGNNFQLLNPNNCVLKYFDGINWCDISCPCDCPPGYTFNPGTVSCESITVIPATPTSGITYGIVAGDQNVSYNFYGSRLYQDITGLTYPLNGYQSVGTSPSNYVVKDNNGIGSILSIQQLSTNPIWKTNAFGTTGRLNIAGIWANNPAPFPDNEWLTVRFCITISKDKQYIFALAGDDQIKASIDSTTFNGGGVTNLVNLYTSYSYTGIPTDGAATNTFKIWHMFPITLPMGTHTLELSGYNNVALTDAAFAAEIYDISDANMINDLMIPATLTPADLEPYIVFTTRDLVSVPPLLVPGPGETVTWACPDGTTLSDCFGVPSCIIIDSVPCSTTSPLKNTTEINVWIDNSSTMITTRQPIELMVSGLLRDCILPIYNNDADLYNERVKVLYMYDNVNGNWNYSERYVRCLAEERNFQRTIDTSVDQVLNLVFTDRSAEYGYGTTIPFNPGIRTAQYDLDITYLRNIMTTVSYDIKGTVFRVNTGQYPGQFPGFKGLVNATFVNNGIYTPPINVNDYYAINFNCNLETLEAGTCEYYRNQISAALQALGLAIPVCL